MFLKSLKSGVPSICSSAFDFSRWWDRNSIKFIDAQAGKLVLLHLGALVRSLDCLGRELRERRWPFDAAMTQRWNDRARQWSLSHIDNPEVGDRPYEFLGKMNNPEDRSRIELLLSDEQV